MTFVTDLNELFLNFLLYHTLPTDCTWDINIPQVHKELWNWIPRIVPNCKSENTAHFREKQPSSNVDCDGPTQNEQQHSILRASVFIIYTTNFTSTNSVLLDWTAQLWVTNVHTLMWQLCWFLPACLRQVICKRKQTKVHWYFQWQHCIVQPQYKEFLYSSSVIILFFLFFNP